MNAAAETRRWWTVLTVLLVLAFALRAWDLDGVPPGLTHDEASNGHDSAAILRGVHRIYFPVGYGHEPLYNYSAALTTLALGQSIFTLRITTVAWGMAQIVVVAALARRWWGRRAALAVVAAYTVSFWALMLSRVGLRAPVLPTLLAASVLAYDHATALRWRTTALRWRTTAVRWRTTALRWRTPRWPAYLLAGVALGASFYTYMASRGMPLLFVGILVAAYLIDRRRFERIWRGTLLTLVTALAVGAPLFLYLRAHPELEQRIGQLGHALTALTAGDPTPLWQNVTASLPLLLWRGDPYWLYNIAERPGLEPLLAALFVVGLIAALSALRDPRHITLLLWLGGGLAPALIAPVAYNLLHAIAAMPAAFLTVALGARTLTRLRPGRTLTPLLAVLAAAAWLATGATTAHAYFITWATHRDVRVAYHHHVVALGRHLDAAPERSPVVITSLYPGEFHDPYTMEVTLRRGDLSLRWADARAGLPMPQHTARLFVEEHTRPSPALWDLLMPDLAPLTALTFEDTDLHTRIEGYAWEADASWDRLAANLDAAAMGQRGDPPPSTPQLQLQTPLNFGDTLTLVGYRLTPDPDRGTGALQLLTAWAVQAPVDTELTIFAHVLYGDGTLVVQDDRLSVPSWQWQPGDRFIQLHHLPDGALQHGVAVAIGLYDQSDLKRLPLLVPGAAGLCSFTRLLLPLESLR